MGGANQGGDQRQENKLDRITGVRWDKTNWLNRVETSNTYLTHVYRRVLRRKKKKNRSFLPEHSSVVESHWKPQCCLKTPVLFFSRLCRHVSSGCPSFLSYLANFISVISPFQVFLLQYVEHHKLLWEVKLLIIDNAQYQAKWPSITINQICCEKKKCYSLKQC